MADIDRRHLLQGSLGLGVAASLLESFTAELSAAQRNPQGGGAPPGVRRIITANNAKGRSYVLSDEVVQAGGWTFGRKGRGYVALWSWQDTVWQDYPPDELARPANGPLTRSFDLVAPGGASNVWIVECGRRADWRSFEAFRQAIVAARVEVTAQPGEFGFAFDVVYESPSQGQLSFGWDAPLFVRGQLVPLGGYPRAESPWLTAERGDYYVFVQGDWRGSLEDSEKQ